MEYEKCLVQVYEILNHLEDEEIAKIPEEMIKRIEEKKDKNYKWEYDESKPLTEQVIDRKTIALLSYINLEYLLDIEEKEIIKEMHEQNEERLFPKIGTVNFSKPKIYETEKETVLVEISKQTWYDKIIIFFKRLFHK